MAKTLEMTFLTESGKQSKISIDSPKEPIDPVAVKAAMGQIIAANAFAGNNGSLASAKSAKLIDRTVTEYEL